MQLSTTFRHMDASQAVRDYAEERLEKIKKYFQKDPISAHAVFSVERDYNHTAEIVITLPSGLVVQARETTEDMYSSIDLAGARIERQVRRWKDKIRDHRPHHGPSFAARKSVVSAGELEPPRESAGKGKGAPAKVKALKGKVKSKGAEGKRVTPAAPAPQAFNIIKETTFTVRSMRLDDAVMQMNLLETEFLVFNDVDTKAVSVVYRRKDGNYGLIETGDTGDGKDRKRA